MKRFLVLATLALCVASAHAADSRQVLVRVENAENAWANSRIYDKLALALTRQNGCEVEPAQTRSAAEQPFPANYLDINRVVEWGQQRGAQYIVLVIVHSERLETRKTFHVPLILHKYEAYGVLEGELRVIDIARMQQVYASPFAVEQSGPRMFQADPDRNINDPDIHLTAPDKIQFFSRLEDRLICWITKELQGPLGRYDRAYVTRPQGHK